jgi:hypothetical protein
LLEKAPRLASPESFKQFYTQHMGEFLTMQGNPLAGQPGFYQNMKDETLYCTVVQGISGLLHRQSDRGRIIRSKNP